VQIEVAKNKGGVGFLFWNANNDYSKPYTAMPEMRLAKGRFFRGDEIGVPRPEPASAVPVAVAPAVVPPAATPVAAPEPGSHPVKIWRH
jgi:hypothetical protein